MVFRAIILLAFAALLSSCHRGQTRLPLARVNDRLTTGTGNVVDTKLKIKGFRNSELAVAKNGIFMQDKYDPAKTPVLLVHGLVSEPNTWEPLVSALRADPGIEEKYQFLFYAYPTSTPTIPASAVFKRHLDSAVKDIEKTHGISLHRKLIVIGHSMGGILSKSLISNTGDKLWNTAFTAPLDQLDVTPAQRKFLGEAFIYKPKPYMKKVIFLATPHRGSGLANGALGRYATIISERPMMIENLAQTLLEKNQQRLQPEFSKFLADKVNSVATLRPDSPVTTVLADLPIDRSLEFHSVAGIRNRRKMSGDGVVSLESTFVEGAYCEVGIYSGHNVHQNPDGISVVRMILLNDFEDLSDRVVVDRLRSRELAFIRYRGIEY